MSKLYSIAKEYEIDWSRAIYLIDAATQRLNYEFDLNPIDFLGFAKQDISSATTYGA